MPTTDPRADQRSRIVEVAAQLLRAGGPIAVTTRGVAEEAGVQAPAIYRLFGDKDGLLEAVAEHVMADFVAAKAERAAHAATQEVDPLDDLRTAWDAQIDFGITNPAVFRFLSDPNRVGTSTAAEAGRRVLEARVHRLAATGRLRVSERRAADLIQSAGVGVIHTLLSTHPESRDTGLSASMFDAVLGRILTGTPVADDSPAPAVALRAVVPQLPVLTEAERGLLVQWLNRIVEAG